MSNTKRIASIIIIIFLLALLIGLSYAYFSSLISGNTSTNNVSVTSGNLILNYTDSSTINEINLLPGWTTTKTIKIKNTGTSSITYRLFWQSLTNKFVDKNDLVYSITCSSSSGSCAGLSQTILPSNTGTIINNQTIASGVTHTYTITFKFLETNNNQNDNVGASFSGVIYAE